jgi:putative NADPH-quinone reductase
MHIIGFNGSPRKNGNTAAIMHEMLRGAQEAGATVEYIHLRSFHIEGCIGCEKCRKDKTCTQFFDGMHLLYPKITGAQGIILGSPTYNYGMTPWMKAFIDRLYPFFDFTEPRPGPYSSRLANLGKRSLVFGVCEQLDPKEAGYTVVNMRDAIEVLGYAMEDALTFPAHFHATSASRDQQTCERSFIAGRRFAESFV